MHNKANTIIAALAIAACLCGCDADWLWDLNAWKAKQAEWAQDNAQPATSNPAQPQKTLSNNEQQQAQQKSSEQTLEYDVATITYRDKTEPTPGNAMLNFAFENKTDKTVMIGCHEMIINDEYSVQVLGGSTTSIPPGKKGSVSLFFGYSGQTALQSIDELHEASCAFTMIDDETYDEISKIHVDVAL